MSIIDIPEVVDAELAFLTAELDDAFGADWDPAYRALEAFQVRAGLRWLAEQDLREVSSFRVGMMSRKPDICVLTASTHHAKLWAELYGLVETASLGGRVFYGGDTDGVHLTVAVIR